MSRTPQLNSCFPSSCMAIISHDCISAACNYNSIFSHILLDDAHCWGDPSKGLPECPLMELR